MMLFAQTPIDAPWLQYGGLGLAGLLIVVGIPWLLNYLSTVNERHTQVIEKIGVAHDLRVTQLIADQQCEREAYAQSLDKVVAAYKEELKSERESKHLNFDKVCDSFKEEMRAEREYAEKRVEAHRVNNERWAVQLQEEVRRLIGLREEEIKKGLV